MRRHIRSALTLLIVIYLWTVLVAVVGAHYDLLAFLVIIPVWLAVIVAIARFTTKAVNNYKGPEYLGGGSGTIMSVGICLGLLVTWGAIELLRAIVW